MDKKNIKIVEGLKKTLKKQGFEFFEREMLSALEKYPDNVALLELWALALISQNKYVDSLKIFESILSLGKELSPEGYDHLGVLLQMQEKYDRALQMHTQALTAQPTHIGFAFNLAVCANHLGQTQVAQKTYENIVFIMPSHMAARVNLATIYMAKKLFSQAKEGFDQAYQEGDRSLALLMGRANYAKLQESAQDAIVAYEEVLQYFPEQEIAQFMVASLKGEFKNRPPESYVEGLFDDFAGHFDKTLTNELSYQAPELVFQALKPYIKDRIDLYCADLGAGTGLFGKLIRPFVSTMTGVDLSRKMLEKAKAQKIYDHYIKGDIVSYMRTQEKERFDLISAVDVLVYVGALEHVFLCASMLLKKGGIFAFTTEVLSADIQDNFYLQETARYAYASSYIQNLAQTYGLTVCVKNKAILRTNKNQPISGEIWILEKG